MNNIKCYYQNFRGLRTKLRDLKISIEGEMYDIIIGTETDTFFDSESINLERYTIFRCDRNSQLSGKERGGGIMIGVNRDFKVLNWGMKDGTYETLWVKIKLKKLHTITLFAVYLPPKLSIEDYKNYLEYFEYTICDERNVYVLGDFNLPNLEHDNKDEEHQFFLDFLEINGFENCNGINNINNRKLDLVLVTQENASCIHVSKSDFPLLEEDINHPVLYIEIFATDEIIRKTRDIESVKYYNFQLCDFLRLTQSIQNIDWTPLFQLNEVDIAVDFFYSELYKVLDTVVPKTSKKRNKYPIWFTKDIKECLWNKNKYRKLKHLSNNFMTLYNAERKHLKRLIKQGFDNYINDIENAIKTDTSTFWTYTKSNKKNSSSSSVFEYNNMKLSDVEVPNSFENYRPIAVLPAPGKLFEQIIYAKVWHKVNNLINEEQHGFVPKKSTSTNLLSFSHDVLRNLENSTQVDVIYTDFQKAFDKVNHDVLLNKLSLCGATKGTMKFLASYLNERMFRVKFSTNYSDEFQSKSGVPQGSNLGPLLFLIFINDLSAEIKYSNYLLFADDLKFYRKIDCVQNCSKLQKDIENVYQWSVKNKLPFNTSKCIVMTCTRKKDKIEYAYEMENITLARVSNVKDLGVRYDSTLSFKKHIETVVSQGLRSLGFVLRQSKHFRNYQTVIRIYNALVRPKLEYCAAVLPF
ncbi:uncharacterized protein [Leptinotarsa decemlineata]|uniref:uncharacterized protein n=1 Tax=Leptinotarsa decemlineata TaxID=7539 RepID=UPI003D307892